MKSRNYRLFGKRLRGRRTPASQSRLAMRQGLVETLEKREMLNADWNPDIVSQTGYFANATGRQAIIDYVTDRAGGGSGGGSPGSSGGPEGAFSPTIVNTAESEPNDGIVNSQLVPLTGNAGVNIVGTNTDPLDADWYAFDLDAGDIIDVKLSSNSGAVVNLPLLSLYNNANQELVSSLQVPGLIPPTSPLTGSLSAPGAAGDVALHYVVPTAGRYHIRISDVLSTYTANIRRYRPVLESGAAGEKQILFLDFDGGIVSRSLFGLGPGSGRLSNTANFLTQYGLQPSDEAELIDQVVARVQNKFDTLGMNTTNPNFGIEIRNSKDHPDPWGQPNVSRVVIGGTWQELVGDPAATNDNGILGIAQSIDVGNFDTTETAIVMHDVLLATFQMLPVSGATPQLEAIAELMTFVVAHEAGHFLGGWHQDPSNNVNVLMDQTYNEIVSSGSGPDGIFGNADDVPIHFGIDAYGAAGGTPFEVGGINDTISIIGWGLSGGTSGGRIEGSVFDDRNLNRFLDPGDAPGPASVVWTDLDNDGLFEPDAGEFFSNTDAAGNYSILATPGTYTVRVGPPTGWRPIAPSTGATTVTVAANQVVSNINFGLELPNQNITGTKWNDSNGNGLRDPGEPGLAGVWIYIDQDNDNRIDIGEPSTQTDANGNYRLNFPGPGTHVVREIVEPGFVQSFPGIEADNEHTIVLTGNPATDAAIMSGLNFGNVRRVDYGDAPASYGVASHGFAEGLRLGQNWDPEPASQFSPTANGDDVNGLLDASNNVIDDEDGITLTRPLVVGSSNNRISVSAINTTGLTGYLQGWVDFNQDGDFADAGERIITNAVVGTGSTDVTFSAPPTALLGNVIARFRYGTEQDTPATGEVATGEVEDYQFTVVGSVNLANDDQFSVSRNSVLNSLDVLANDFQVPGEVLEVVSVGATSAGGITQVSTNNTVLYTPPNSFIGQDVFTYTMRNSSNELATATVVVDVNLFFENPMAIDDSFDLPVNAIDFPLNVLANDIEGQDGALVIVSTTQPDKGGQINIATGGKSLRYTPARNFGGTETFTYTVADAGGNRSTTTVTLHTLPGDQADDDVLIQLVATDLAGTPISAIQQGQQFKIDVIVDDLRFDPSNPGNSAGVFAAYADLLYSLQLVSTVAATDPSDRFAFEVDFFNDYTNFQTGDATIPGIINEFGAFSTRSVMNDPNPTRLASITFSARSPGIARFTPDPADVFPASDTLLFDTSGTAVPIERIRYVGTSLEIVGDGVEFPVAVDDSVAQLIPNGTVGFPVNVLANDRPGSTGSIQIVSSADGLNGTTTIDTRGTPTLTDDRVLYTPNGGFNGADQFTYTIQDARGIQSTATVTVRVGVADDNDIIALRLSATDLNGQAIDQITVGSQFQLRGYVQDLRTAGTDLGVFSAYEDVLYSSTLVSPVASITNDPNLGFQVQFGPNYQRVREGDIRTPGVINEIGAVSTGDLPLGNSEQLLFIVTMTANAVGQASFIGDPADVLPLHDSLTFEPVQPVGFDQIRFGFDTLNIVSSTGGGNGEGFTNNSNPYDVNNDGFVSPIDALGVINTLNRTGSGPLRAGGGEGEAGRLYVDVNADGSLSPLDVLWVINHLNDNAGSGEGEDASLLSGAPPVTSPSGLKENGSETPEPSILAPLTGKPISSPMTGPDAGPAAGHLLTDGTDGLPEDADDDIDSIIEQLAPIIEENWKKKLFA